MGAILIIIALIILALIGPFVFIYSLIRLAIGSTFKIWWFEVNKYYRDIAYYVDVLGNIAFQVPMNDILIKPDGYKFGQAAESISHVLKVNKDLGTLRWAGSALCWFLDSIDKDHIDNSRSLGLNISYWKYLWINTKGSVLIFIAIGFYCLKVYFTEEHNIFLLFFGIVLPIGMPLGYFITWLKDKK